MNMSKRLENEVDAVLPYCDFTTYFPKLVFHNPNTEFELRVTDIYAFDIQQNFIDSYMSEYKLEISVNIAEYNQLLENIQDLECTLVLYPYSSVYQRILTNIEPIIFKTRAIFNKVDLSTIVGIKNLGEQNDEGVVSPETANQAQIHMKLPVYLVEHEVYDTRHIQINGILHNVTMEGVIHWVAYQFGFENVSVVTPDNDDVYSNLVIPPMQSIATIFPYLQNTFGIYSKGLGYFITNNSLYVYPQFDTTIGNSHSSSVLHIVSIPKGNFPSSPSYSTTIDEDLWVVSITNANVNDTSTTGVENRGNVHASVNADNNRDGGVVVNKDGSVVRDAENITVVQTALSESANTDSQIMKFSGVRTNIYNSTSEMSAYNGVYLNTGWVRSKPCAILPGQSVIYHYDDVDDEFSIKHGRVMGVTYNSELLPSSTGTDVLITFMSVIYVFLEPKKKE